jgi:hypothetical protein
MNSSIFDYNNFKQFIEQIKNRNIDIISIFTSGSSKPIDIVY